jgi:hypothetical protein
VTPFPRLLRRLARVATVLLIVDRTDGRSLKTKEIGLIMRLRASDEKVTEDS